MTRKDGPLLSSLQMCNGCSLSKREIQRAYKGIKRAINSQASKSLGMIAENPSTQQRNKPKLNEGRPLRTAKGITKTSRHFTKLWVVTFRNCSRKDSNFEIYHTFNSKNKTITSLTAIDGISRHLIAGGIIAKFETHQTIYNVNSPNINSAKFSRYMV